MKKYSSLSKIILRNTIMTIPYLLFSIIAAIISPFVPHTTYGFGVEKPSSLLNYLTIVLKTYLAFVGFILFIIILVSLIEFAKSKINNRHSN